MNRLSLFVYNLNKSNINKYKKYFKLRECKIFIIICFKIYIL